MSAKQSVYMTIFGLSLRELNDLKNTIKSMAPHHIDIQWTNVAESKLQTLLINEDFFKSPSIQRLLQNNRIKVLKVKSRSDRPSIIENGMLHLPVNDRSALQQWLSENVFESKIETLVEQAEREKLQQAEEKQFKAKQQKQNAKKTYASKAEFVQDLLDPKNGRIQIFDRHGVLGIADTQRQTFLVDKSRIKKNTDQTINFTYATMTDSARLSETKQQNLQSYLWNLFWRSPSYLDFAPQKGAMKLLAWPQAEEGFDRRDILRLSACFAEGADMEFVAEHLQLDYDRVRQYVVATVTAGLGEMISKSQAKFELAPKTNHTHDDQQAHKFLGGLRRRFGL